MLKKKAKKPSRPSATIADLLGPKSPSRRVPRKWQEAYDRLVKLREDFSRQQASLSKDAGPTAQFSGMHMADAGTDASEQDMVLGVLSFDSDTVQQIDLAIERIRNGTYGVCELTGKAISQERLKAVPWARFSADAEKQLEREGQRPRVGAGLRSGAIPQDGGAAEPPDEEADAKDQQ